MLALPYSLCAVAAIPLARASAVPVWESSINRKTRNPTAAMGTTTIRMKKLVSRVRKLMVPGGPPSVSADLAAL
jgi:hypothetical protein